MRWYEVVAKQVETTKRLADLPLEQDKEIKAVTYNGHMATTTKQTMELVMERFQTVVATRRAWNPAFVAKIAIFRIGNEQIH